MEDSALTFARPAWLYAAPLLCAGMAWLLLRFDQRRRADLAKLVHPRFRSRLLPDISPRLHLAKRLLWLATLLLLCFAAAGPQKGFEFREVKRRGIDILFAVDTSRSMLAEDLSPNRLERARLGIHDFIQRLEGDRVGLIPFAGSAYALCPLTSDYDAFRESLDALDTDLIPKQGTDVASAIREAQRLFDEQNNNHRILVLITDGEDLQGDALEAAAECAKKGMTIYPVGVGSPDGVNIPVRQPNGRVDLLRDQSGAPVTTRLDEATLRRIAEAARGLYVPLGRGAEGLDTIYREKLRLVPKNEIDGRMEKIPLERYEWPLAFAILCLVLEFLLPEHRRAARTAGLPSAARRASLLKATSLGAALFFGLPPTSAPAQPPDPRALYNQGTAAYSSGDYQASAESLRSALQTPDLSLQNRAYYNLGNALYRLGQESQAKSPDETIKQWEAAHKAYADAMALDPGDADARFNHDLVQRKMEALKQQNPDQKKDDQKQDGKDQKDSQDKKEDGDKKDGDKSSGGDQQGEKKEGEGKDGKSGEEGKDSEKKEGSGSKEGQDEKQADGASQPDGKDGKDGKDGEKTAGESKDGQDKNKEGEPSQAAGGKEEKSAAQETEEKSSAEERRKPGEMTATEARQLMQMMRGEERTVIPLERPRGRFIDPNNTTKGKTW